ncbi:MAG TPA: DUF4922 domain-containing protein [Bacteroidota bacterium]|nr:DUF4922 domain-containing protein [Bacteroidota bacterium]
MLEHLIFERFDSSSTLSEQSLRLLHQQQETWPQLIEGYAAFADVKKKPIECSGYSVVLQWNPKRIVSSAAKTDPKSIRDRPCFLSVENLPPEQRGILYRNEFLVLCNPAPIVDRHLTISHIEHVPQAVETYLGTMFLLAKDFSPSFTVVYNGARCGASAPDHMHFQACPTGVIPVEIDVVGSAHRHRERSIDGVDVLTMKDFGREVIVLEGTEMSALVAVFQRLMRAMRVEEHTEEEPKINLLCSYANNAWRTIVFPRTKHRPDVYYKEGDEQVLLSPATIDIGGLPVVPLERDFLRVDRAMIESIFAEVSLDRASVARIIAAL